MEKTIPTPQCPECDDVGLIVVILSAEQRATSEHYCTCRSGAIQRALDEERNS